jgi:hypothetical protein
MNGGSGITNLKVFKEIYIESAGFNQDHQSHLR